MTDDVKAPMYRHGNLFYVHAIRSRDNDGAVVMAVASNRSERKALLWNARLGGMNSGALRSLPNMVTGMNISLDDDGYEVIDECQIDAAAVDNCEIRAVTRMKTDASPGKLPEEKVAEKPGHRIIVDGWPMGECSQL